MSYRTENICREATLAELREYAKGGCQIAIDEAFRRLAYENRQADIGHREAEFHAAEVERYKEQNSVLSHAFMDMKLMLSSLRDRIDDQIAESDEIRKYVEKL